MTVDDLIFIMSSLMSNFEFINHFLGAAGFEASLEVINLRLHPVCGILAGVLHILL